MPKYFKTQQALPGGKRLMHLIDFEKVVRVRVVEGASTDLEVYFVDGTRLSHESLPNSDQFAEEYRAYLESREHSA